MIPPTVGPLPIDEFLPKIRACLLESPNLILVASPGAGKTTRVPPALLACTNKQIRVIEPRRIAAIGAAMRVAEEQGWRIGETEVGYQVRFDSQKRRDTRLIFETEGMLARELLEDPELKDVGIVIIDEFQVRSASVDLSLGILKELQLMRPDLKIVIMSATLEVEPLHAYLEDVRIVHVPGKLFPLEIFHSRHPLRRQIDDRFWESFITQTAQAASETPHDVLAFLPGSREIRKAKAQLSSHPGLRDREILELFGAMSIDQQAQVIKPRSSSVKRMILATNIAETSLTIDGVGAVVDSGLERVSQYNPQTGFSRLELVAISKASATQRSGRAARQFAGRAYRLYGKSDEAAFQDHLKPEILRVDLTEPLLLLAGLGVTDPKAFLWFESPTRDALESASKTLVGLGATNAAGSLTDMGKKLLRLPVHPRLGAWLMSLSSFNAHPALLEAAVLSVAIVSEGLSVERLSQSSQPMTGENDLEQLATAYFDQPQLRRVHQSLMLRLGLKVGSTRPAAWPWDELGLTLVDSHLHRIARRRGYSDRALMVGGRGVQLHDNSSVRSSELWIAIDGRDVVGRPDSLVTIGVGIDKESLREKFSKMILPEQRVVFDPIAQKFYVEKCESLNGLPISDWVRQTPTPDDVFEELSNLLFDSFQANRIEIEPLRLWLLRFKWFHVRCESPELDLEQILRDTFRSAAVGEISIADAIQKDLVSFVEAQLPNSILRQFSSRAPREIQLPSGKWRTLDYPADSHQPARLSIRLQDAFGWPDTPKIFFGREALLMELLAPNLRPVQLTQDLAHFWKSGYLEIRKELRARYPKHKWPEDPTK